jgi:hypothetical protein
VKENTMHQRSSHPVKPAFARRMSAALSLSALVLPALACLSGCGEAYNLGADEPAAEEESTCDGLVSTSGTFFARNQAEVDALRGCRELPGALQIRAPDRDSASFSLAPLSELEVVDGLLSISGPLQSLAGLESLQRVASLQLVDLLVSDLAPLASLGSVQRGPADERVRGLISIERCDELIDLTGLENLTTWSSLRLQDLENLVTLEGLQTPLQVEEVEISTAPSLADVSALATLQHVQRFSLSYTAVANLDGFALETAGSVGLSFNDALTDLDGLGRLRALDTLVIIENDGLLRIELPSLEDFAAITIAHNAVLRAVPHYKANTGSWPQAFGVDDYESYLRPSRALFDVGDNPQLESIILPTDFTDIEQVAIYQNASLKTLELGNLIQSNHIWIKDNASLDTVSAPALVRVDELSILNNPALSVTPFANVQTFEREVTGNLDELAP